MWVWCAQVKESGTFTIIVISVATVLYHQCWVLHKLCLTLVNLAASTTDGPHDPCQPLWPGATAFRPVSGRTAVRFTARLSCLLKSWGLRTPSCYFAPHSSLKMAVIAGHFMHTQNLFQSVLCSSGHKLQALVYDILPLRKAMLGARSGLSPKRTVIRTTAPPFRRALARRAGCLATGQWPLAQPASSLALMERVAQGSTCLLCAVTPLTPQPPPPPPPPTHTHHRQPGGVRVSTQTPSTGLRHPSFGGGRCRKAMLAVRVGTPRLVEWGWVPRLVGVRGWDQRMG